MLRVLYGSQYSNQNNAFGNAFVESLDQYNNFGNREQHWHHVVAVGLNHGSNYPSDSLLKSPAVVSSPSAEQCTYVDDIGDGAGQSVPTSVSNRLTEVAQEHNITPQLQPNPTDFEIAACRYRRVFGIGESPSFMKSMVDPMGSRCENRYF